MFLWEGGAHNAAGSEAITGSQQTPSEVQTNLYILKSLEPTLPFLLYCPTDAQGHSQQRLCRIGGLDMNPGVCP